MEELKPRGKDCIGALSGMPLRRTAWISLDELAALDADNERLRRLLAEQLHAQNLLLKKMLARFDAG